MDPKNNLLQKWMEEFNREEIRAVQGLGKYHLAQEHQTFAVDPATGINGGRSAELKELTYSINTHHLLSAPTKSQKMLFKKLHLGPINVEQDCENRNCLKKELKYH